MKEEKGTKICFICGRSVTDNMGVDIAKMLGELKKRGIYVAGVKVGNYLCKACSPVLIDYINGEKLHKDSSGISAFMEYINSSAFLFKMETPQVIQACFNVFTEGVLNHIAPKNPELAISIFEVSLEALRDYIDTIKDIKEKYDKIKKVNTEEQMNKSRENYENISKN